MVVSLAQISSMYDIFRFLQQFRNYKIRMTEIVNIMILIHSVGALNSEN